MDHRMIAAARDGKLFDPPRCEGGRVFFVKVLAADTVGKAFHGDRPIFDMRQDVWRYGSVKLNHLALGKMILRVHDLVEIGKCQFFAAKFFGVGCHC